MVLDFRELGESDSSVGVTVTDLIMGLGETDGKVQLSAMVLSFAETGNTGDNQV